MPPPDLRVCFLGDSLTAGVGDDAALGWVGRLVVAARGAGTDLTGYNLGVRRETAPEVAARWMAEAAPRLRHGDGCGVVLAVGVNDTTVEGGRRRVPEAGTLGAVDLVADQAGAEGWPLLVVGPTLVADAEQNRRITALSAAMADRCGRRSLPFVELAAGLDDEWLADVASGDGAHPSARGYERLSRSISPVFTTWLGTLADRRTG
ncbi:GDSL-type esterase/lipase family protein [Blastococcus sp. VKM Ac-2987]|uniref:GDSL-type esterase/lipase family protein n=1 Tax=Blastococcus sp. VKM Ac-2987 TaxID=3004141 RepID=UPI0022AB97A9|nr:GDSL-type esterase/lipase family protein [Blastococcus sp. VKM Ac-2987]MCZ2858000.1 GDSL-type esterase/lipase family protein [Blastococcus sp. VKM Ac-2987]